jgi:hypothetical protein
MARKPTHIIQLRLRMPEWLRAEIAKKTKKTGRSLNGEIVHMLTVAQQGADVERQFAELKELFRKETREIIESAERRNEYTAVIRDLLQILSRHSLELTDEERALWKRLEELTGATGLHAKQERLRGSQHRGAQDDDAGAD